MKIKLSVIAYLFVGFSMLAQVTNQGEPTSWNLNLTNEGVSVKALTKDTTLERLSVIPTVSDCEELNANAVSSEIDRVSVLEVENESAGESVSEMLNAFALSPTKKRFLLSGSSLTSASTRLTNCKEVCRSTKSKSVEVLADKFRDAICWLLTVMCSCENDTDIFSAISQNHLLL